MCSARSATSALRLVPELRSVHLERHVRFGSGRLLYLSEKYDLGGLQLPPGIEKVTLRGAVRAAWRSDADVFEVPEPLWMRFLPALAVLVLSWRIGGALRGRRRTTVTYAMELAPLATLLGGGRRVPRWLVRSAAFLIGAFTAASFDRIGFATPASRDLYRSLPFVGRVRSRLVLELPAPARRVERDAGHRAAADADVAFVGLLAPRNGVRVLMRAWEIVERTRPDAALAVIGGGDLECEVSVWAASRPASRIATGQLPRTVAVATLAEVPVLAAPSIPDGRWIEQVGLPIKEALSQGCTVVTTRQTGLANWLDEHGHRVLAVDGGLVESLARALLDAMSDPLPRADVLDSLPDVEGRECSQAWLHAVNVHVTCELLHGSGVAVA